MQRFGISEDVLKTPSGSCNSTVTTLTWMMSGDDESIYREEVFAPGRQGLLTATNPVFRSANLIVAPLTFCAPRSQLQPDPAMLAGVPKWVVF